MTAPFPSAANERLLDEFSRGAKVALARAVSVVENHRAGFDTLLAALQPKIGRARRIGLTGPPGAGKSTLTTQLVQLYRDASLTVGVVAVDPTSPFTGGAMLGDRIRMEAVALDPGVFIRSMATRGSLGGLAISTGEVADVIDAFGMGRVLIETVGVGQTELDISRTADTTVVVLVPESGDSIQALKAGLMEIADVFVVNKADRPGADRLCNELELMLGLRPGGTLKNAPPHRGVDLSRTNPARGAREPAPSGDGGHWTPPVLRTTASRGEGIREVIEALDRHFHYLETSGELHRRRRMRLRAHVMEIVATRVRNRLWGDDRTNGWLDEQLPALESGRSNPFAVADALLAQSGTLLTQVPS